MMSIGRVVRTALSYSSARTNARPHGITINQAASRIWDHGSAERDGCTTAGYRALGRNRDSCEVRQSLLSYCYEIHSLDKR